MIDHTAQSWVGSAEGRAQDGISYADSLTWRGGRAGEGAGLSPAGAPEKGMRAGQWGGLCTSSGTGAWP